MSLIKVSSSLFSACCMLLLCLIFLPKEGLPQGIIKGGCICYDSIKIYIVGNYSKEAKYRFVLDSKVVHEMNVKGNGLVDSFLISANALEPRPWHNFEIDLLNGKHKVDLGFPLFYDPYWHYLIIFQDPRMKKRNAFNYFYSNIRPKYTEF